MDSLKKILVAVDFSPCSEAALKQAARIGIQSRAKVTALHVVEPPVYAVPDGIFIPIELPPTNLLLSEAREQWKKWPAARQIGGSVTFEAVLGSPRAELLERVRSDSIDLLVVGAHGEFDATRRVGSIAAACVQRAATKVMVVREEQDGPFRSVLACVDFSEASSLALGQAIRVSALDGAALHVLHVYDDPWSGLEPPDRFKANMPDFAARYRRAVEKRLQAFCEPSAHEVGALRATLHATQSVKGRYGVEIVDFATRESCDLVVLGAGSKWNLRDYFLGSTAERVVREAPCAVLAVRPPEVDST